jgi:carbonic anhydrase
MHMVNQTAAGKTAVVTVFLGQGAANEAYGRVFSNLPAPKGHDTGPDGTIDPTALLPPESSRAKYYAYDGSLTTPPCTEGVKFLIFVPPVTVSPAQLGVLLAAYDHNSRPVQPLNGRVVQ